MDGDIRAYFDNVPHAQLMQTLGQYVDDGNFINLIAQWLEMSAQPGLGLPQGAPISPILANLYLDCIDEIITAHGFRMVRYADDFIILCRSEARAENALARVAEELAKLGLELNPEKTAIRSIQKGYRFLGRSFNRHTLGRQIAELGEEALPASGRGEPRPVSALDGRLETPHQRRILGRELPVEPASKGRSPDFPWINEPGRQQYLTEGENEHDDTEQETGQSSRRAQFIRPLYVYEKGRMVGTRNAVFTVMEGEFVLNLVSHRYYRPYRNRAGCGYRLRCVANGCGGQNTGSSGRRPRYQPDDRHARSIQSGKTASGAGASCAGR